MNTRFRSRIRDGVLRLLLLLCGLLAAVGLNPLHAQERKTIYQINVGGPAVGSYSADSYFEGGSKYDNRDGVDTADVPNAPPTAAYRSQRYGNFLYAFPDLKPNGSYLVRLHFAEIYFDKTQVGKRVFDVSINRKLVLDHFDILKAAGDKDRAIVKEFTVKADEGGRISVKFVSDVTNAAINAIEIIQVSDSSGEPPSPMNPATSSTAFSTTSTRANSSSTTNLNKPSTTPARGMCTDEDAQRKPGVWDRGANDITFTDNTFPKDQYPLIFDKADKVIALLKQAIPKPVGVAPKAQRSIRGKPYVANGPLPFSVNVPVFDYECLPATSTDPAVRGKIVLGDETGTWIYFYFNGLGSLAGNQVGHTVSGARIFVMPKQDGDLKGYPLLLPELNVGKPDEAIIITPDGHLPFKPLSREKFLLGQEKYYQGEVDKLQKVSPVPLSAVNQRQNELAAITSLLNGMSPEEKQSQAIVKLPVNPRGRIFVSEADGGKPLVTIDAKWFEPTSSRTAVRIITVYWSLDRSSVAESALINQFKEKFDFQALRQMLDK